MKTLDEVISTMEYEQAYNAGEARDYDADALHYLKEYRSDMLMYAENQKYWEDELKQKIKDFGDAKERYIARLKELDIGTLNPPLTWDELRQMEGKPVWVEYDGYKPMWDIVDKIIDKRTIETYKCMLHEEGIGIYWQAYRKERE